MQDGSELVLVLTGDATGGWRGDAVTHGELGIGSWAKGKAQSRLTLLPLFLVLSVMTLLKIFVIEHRAWLLHFISCCVMAA